MGALDRIAARGRVGRHGRVPADRLLDGPAYSQPAARHPSLRSIPSGARSGTSSSYGSPGRWFGLDPQTSATTGDGSTAGRTTRGSMGSVPPSTGYPVREQPERPSRAGR